MKENRRDRSYPARRLTPGAQAILRREHASWIRHIVKSALVGFALGIICAVVFLRLDFNGLGSMLASSPNRWGYTALLLVGFAYTGGLLVMGAGIMAKAQLPEWFEDADETGRDA